MKPCAGCSGRTRRLLAQPPVQHGRAQKPRAPVNGNVRFATTSQLIYAGRKSSLLTRPRSKSANARSASFSTLFNLIRSISPFFCPTSPHYWMPPRTTRQSAEENSSFTLARHFHAVFVSPSGALLTKSNATFLVGWMSSPLDISEPNRAIDSDAWQALFALAGARHRGR